MTKLLKKNINNVKDLHRPLPTSCFQRVKPFHLIIYINSHFDDSAIVYYFELLVEISLLEI